MYIIKLVIILEDQIFCFVKIIIIPKRTSKDILIASKCGSELLMVIENYKRMLKMVGIINRIVIYRSKVVLNIKGMFGIVRETKSVTRAK